MKAITICEPFAWAILQGIKRIENRSWQTAYRGPLLIHAGKSRRWLNGGPFTLPTGETVPPAAALVFGAILGTVELVDCVPVRKVRHDPYAEGPFCFVLADPRPLSSPIFCAGQLGLWAPRKRIVLPGRNHVHK